MLLLLALACDPCAPDEVTPELGDWNDILMPQGASACAKPRSRGGGPLVVRRSGDVEALSQDLSTALERVGWKAQDEAGVFTREGKKTTLELSAHSDSVAQVQLSLSDDFDLRKSFPDWDERIARAKLVEEQLLAGEWAREGALACPEGTRAAGLIDLRVPRRAPATTSSFRLHVGFPTLEGRRAEDPTLKKERYAYAKALTEQPMALGGVIDTIEAEVVSAEEFTAGHTLGMVWIIRDGEVLCQAPFHATNEAVLGEGVDWRGTVQELVQQNLDGRTGQAMVATLRELEGR
jgi:hypothetical protein